MSRPVPWIDGLPSLIGSFQELVNSPWLVGEAWWDVCVEERGRRNKMVEALVVIVVDICLWIMQVDPFPNLHGQFFRVLFCIFEVGMVPFLSVLESGSLSASNAFEPGAERQYNRVS